MLRFASARSYCLKMFDTRGRHYITIEITIRFILTFIFIATEYAEPFKRKIQAEEVWLYRNPRTPSYVPTYMLWPIIVIIPVCIIFTSNLMTKQRTDGIPAILGLSLAFGINGVVTNIVKLIVGRPRPDYFFRCFPNGDGELSLPCTGNKDDIIEGLKSFPSGHSSFIFASMTYCSLYLSGKLQPFTPRGRGESWRVIACLSPLLFAIAVAVSRTCDYHHHWQDVLAGSLLGISISWLSYFQYYPSVKDMNCTIPLNMLPVELNHTEHMKKTDSLEDVAVKWI